MCGIYLNSHSSFPNTKPFLFCKLLKGIKGNVKHNAENRKREKEKMCIMASVDNNTLSLYVFVCLYECLNKGKKLPCRNSKNYLN